MSFRPLVDIAMYWMTLLVCALLGFIALGAVLQAFSWFGIIEPPPPRGVLQTVNAPADLATRRVFVSPETNR